MLNKNHLYFFQNIFEDKTQIKPIKWFRNFSMFMKSIYKLQFSIMDYFQHVDYFPRFVNVLIESW